MFRLREQTSSARKMEEAIDMAGNMNDLMNMYQQMRGDPISFLGRRFNIPQDMKTPDDILQHLLNSGQVTQTQVNRAMNMRSNPIIQRLMGMK